MLEINKIPMEGLYNTRDLGGFPTADGRQIRAHRLLRSGELFQATESDKRMLLEEYDLKLIIDFRTNMEISGKPDPELPGVRYIRNPILEETTIGITREEDADSAGDMKQFYTQMQDPSFDGMAYMASIYGGIITSPYSISQYRKFFEHLLTQEEGAVLWHCSAGKDRVGVGTVLLLSALGVSRDVILKDYLKVNDYARGECERTLKAKFGDQQDEVMITKMMALFGVDTSYLNSVYQAIEERYGSMNDLLEQQLGLDDEKLASLRNLYLE